MGVKKGTEIRGTDPNCPLVMTFTGMTREGSAREWRHNWDLCLRYDGRHAGHREAVDRGLGFISIANVITPTLVDAFWQVYITGKTKGIAIGEKHKIDQIKHVLEVG